MTGELVWNSSVVIEDEEELRLCKMFEKDKLLHSLLYIALYNTEC